MKSHHGPPRRFVHGAMPISQMQAIGKGCALTLKPAGRGHPRPGISLSPERRAV